MPQYIVTFKDGERVAVMAQTEGEARRKARGVRRFRGEDSAIPVTGTQGPNPGTNKVPPNG